MEKTRSGVIFFDFRKSTGPEAKNGDYISMHYKVGLTEEEVIKGPWLDNSWEREPIKFRLGDGILLRGIEEGIVGMRVAGERRLVVPPELAFAEKGVPGKVKPNATLYFEIYIVSIEN